MSRLAEFGMELAKDGFFAWPDFLALDFETGGTDPRRHAPVSIGVAVMHGKLQTGAFETYIGPRLNKKGDPEREYDVTALSKSGTTWKQIKDAPTPAEVWEELAGFIDRTESLRYPIVSHNAAFDQAFWSELRFMAGEFDKRVYKYVMPEELLLGPWLCTRRLSSHLRLADETLDTVAAHFGLARSSDKHGALEDAVLAGRIYHALTHPVTEAPSPRPSSPPRQAQVASGSSKDGGPGGEGV